LTAPGARASSRLAVRGPECLRRATAFLPALLLLAGCGREDIRVYRAPKDREPPLPAAAQAAESGVPRVQWRLPEGWQELPPGQMRAGYFSVTGQGGQKAQVTIIALPGLAGSDWENVNRWRSQVGLGPIGQDELGKFSEPVDVGGHGGQLFEFAGHPSNRQQPVRLLVAMLRREGLAWFFKMIGEDALVRQQKAVFVDFLKGVSFESGAK
jgi:hypothetical protein